jgi:hypothetical protein
MKASTTIAAHLKRASILFCLLTLSACVSKSPIICNELASCVINGDYPKSIAILPFKNSTGIKDLETMVRANIYGRMSILPYHDIELEEIDEKLREEDLYPYAAFSKIPVTTLGGFFNCDAVMFGEVTYFNKIFAGIYSQMAVEAIIQIWDTRNGRKLWSDRHMARAHEGGIPLNIIILPLISVRTTMNLSETVKVQVVDDLAYHLVQRLPAPKSVTNKTPPEYEYELQVGAFLDENRALFFYQQLRDKGYTPQIKSNRDTRGLWHRVLLGPFQDRDIALQVQKQVQKELGAAPFITRVVLKSDNS